MGQFACIHFNQNNILISKKELASIKEVEVLGYPAYQVDVPFLAEELMPKQWMKLEQQLDDYNIEYIIMHDTKVNGFEAKTVVTGEKLKPYLAKPILDYINKYGLIKKNKLFLKVGIISGDIEQMLSVITSILDEVTDLTIFSDTPYMYKELLGEIYQQSRLKAKSMVPCAASLQGIDVIFDCSGMRNYAKWCNPKAIYIDFNQYFVSRTTKFTSYPPSIWYDFDIVCDRQSIPIDVLQSIFYTQGIFKRSIPQTFKKIDLSIAKPYTMGIS